MSVQQFDITYVGKHMPYMGLLVLIPATQLGSDHFSAFTLAKTGIQFSYPGAMQG